MEAIDSLFHDAIKAKGIQVFDQFLEFVRRFNRFSVERLMRFLTQLGKDIEIRIAARPARRSRSGVRISHVA